MSQWRERYNLKPLVIHANYLVNLAGGNSEFHAKSISCFSRRGGAGAGFVRRIPGLHPGSFRGSSREEGLRRVALAIEQAVDGLNIWSGRPAHSHREHRRIGVLPRRQLRAGCRTAVPAARLTFPSAPASIPATPTSRDTTSSASEGFADTLDQLDRTVGLGNVYVWHCNDAKAARGSKLDRHQHIGKGSIGLEPFRRLLNDPRLADAAFIAETPIDEPLDDLTNVNALKSLAPSAAHQRTPSTAKKKAVKRKGEPAVSQ